MATIPIRDVPGDPVQPSGNELILIDNGIAMQKATINDAVTPKASEIADQKIADLNLGTASQANVEDFATAEQGNKADSAVQPQDLADVATSGEYDDLLNKPELGTAAAANIGETESDVAAGNRGLPSGGGTGEVLIKNSESDYDAEWREVASATAVSYAPQALDPSEQAQARENIGLGDPIYGDPIVVLATGQSNIQNTLPLAWSPPDNLFTWNGHATNVGTAFAAASSSQITMANSFGAAIARANPTRQVYVINIGLGSQSIKQWMVGATGTDMYAAAKASVEAALAVLGKTTIDHLLWWQGESDFLAGSTTYVSDFQEVFGRFIQESWFPRETRITVMGVSPYYASIPPMRIFNNTLRRVVDIEPQFRTFVDTGALSSSYWEPSGAAYLHANANGLRVMGQMAYRAMAAGAGVGRVATPWQTVVKRANEAKSDTTTLTPDAELKLEMRPGVYRIRGSVTGITVAAADFKFGFSGPAVQLLQGKYKVVKEDAATTETVQMYRSNSAYPTNQTVLVGGSNVFTIDFDWMLETTEAGVFAFEWAQNTATVTNFTRVNHGSWMEMVQVF